ncbi:DUF2141 domain-containing protein [Tenacibaculum sp. 190524A02b]|uniref:DUF2141 domain-containing protein n=1 Tax=Tenacibaculum vairaonense TaxID=3137860 RepID=A0ABM9PIY8_9FLAO
MQKIVLITLFYVMNLLVAQAQDTVTITATFKGMQSDTGNLYVGLYNKEADFLKKRYKSQIVSVKNQQAMVKFTVPVGTYAISSYHDENENQKMDTSMFGIPKEPIGMSNNAKGFMGPPKYKDAKFEAKENIQIIIQVQ